MHIWLVCQYFKPEPGAPSARWAGLLKRFIDAGERVTALTAVPNHPDGIIPESYKQQSRWLKEEVDGIPVWRHPLYVTRNSGFVKKSLSHLSFAFTLLANLWRVKPADRPDVIVTSSPAFFAAISAWLLSVRYKVPFVMEVRDLWPGIFVELGVMKKGLVYNILEKIELFLYHRAAAVVTVTTGFKEDIVARGLPAEKIHVITNGVADSEYKTAIAPRKDGSLDALRNELSISPLTKIVLYIGTHGTSQALGQMIDAARLLLHRSDTLFLLVGDGADKPRLKELASGMPNVQFLPMQPKERVWPFYNLGTICLVPLKDTPGFDTFIPSKMFEIMAAQSVPVGCVRGEAAAILEKSGGAAVVGPEDPENLAKTLEELLDNPTELAAMGEAGRQFVGENYLHSILAKRYLAALQETLPSDAA